MNKSQGAFHDESTLESILRQLDSTYREPDWLLGDFTSNVWHCQFSSEHHFDVDFRVKLNDGSLLDDPKNVILLDTFKTWVCAHTSPDANGGQPPAPSSSYHLARRVFRLTDYFLLRADSFKLGTHGLALVVENDLIKLLSELACNRLGAISIYQWPERLTAFIRDGIRNTPRNALEHLLEIHPDLFISIIDQRGQLTQLNDSELPLARAFLMLEGLYRRTTSSTEFAYAPNTLKLAEIIYKNTLLGSGKKPQAPELMFGELRYDSEFPKQPVRGHSENAITYKEWSEYKSALDSLRLLSKIDLPVPVFALDCIDAANISRGLNFPALGRYKTLDHIVVMNALKDAIEFSLSYGDDIVASALRMLKFSKTKGISLSDMNGQLDVALSPSLKRLGVKLWHLRGATAAERPGVQGVSGRPKGQFPRQEYFRRFRANEGLYELLRVLVGCVQIVVGSLMARRQGEICDLLATRSLDKSGRWLIFENRKSGAYEMRDTEARPIPPIAARMIRMLEHLHRGLLELNLENPGTPLFSFPTAQIGKACALRPQQYNDTMDYFCDYFQLSLDPKGRRIYIRQHQLRRFLALLFFYAASMDGLDTLRWFLGQTDVKHLWHYISESTPGAVLQSVRSYYAAERLLHESPDAQELATLVEQRFGTRNFSVLDSAELEEYIEELMHDQRVSIEPHFLTVGGVRSYKILITVTEISAGSISS